MNKTRWCIIGGPRTGSTWLESLISSPLRSQHNFIQIAEFFEYSNQFNFKLNLVNNLTLCQEPATTDKKDLFLTRLSMLQSSNIEQPIVMRLFVKPYNFPKLDYLKLVKELQNLNFNFMLIKRDILDRTLSWYIANETQIMHKSVVNGKTILSTQNKGRIEGDIAINNITVDVDKFKQLYSLILQEIPILNNLIKEFNIPIIHYNTLKQDLKAHKIQFGVSNLLKLHTLPYCNFITNYDNIVDIANVLNKENNYDY